LRASSVTLDRGAIAQITQPSQPSETRISSASTRQNHSDPTGAWRDAGVPKETAAKIEDAILTRAREIHLSLVQ